MTAGRDSGASRLKETHKSSNRESNGQKEDMIQKRKHDDRERDSSSSSPKEKILSNEQYQGKATHVNNHDANAKKTKSLHSDKATNYAADGI